MYIFIAFLSGILVILSMILNSHLSSKIGVFKSCRMNFLTGLIVIYLIIFVTKGPSKNIIYDLPNYPFWIYLGGAIGVIIVSISNIVILKIPTIYSTLIIFIGQLFTGIFIDYVLFKNFSLGKLIGGLLIISGLIYNFKIDTKKEENAF
ncbi:DMT family transporter [Tepidibacter formicigenes]|jgi:transporter family-2 protein|uniref:Transporter family-2 protein n=1 Tax=Tepidibacter formicigenes DSM 15518 TaxID=1123349 RepID=A0A1M6NVU1_9FIRM|nr:DMT family transporter [Tepidibacter formicigenes]SHJ99877.1 transporter family-2 protein [Tepidibacter formicigenes DSM 15518]